MPIYEYLCEECTHSFEALVIHDEKVSCPTCNSDHIAKQYSRFGMASGASKYDSLPLYKGGGGGCGCTPASCGCKHG